MKSKGLILIPLAVIFILGSYGFLSEENKPQDNHHHLSEEVHENHTDHDKHHEHDLHEVSADDHHAEHSNSHSESNDAAHGEDHGDGGDEKFAAGKFIFDHINDSYDWHVLTWNHKHVSIPLPVILISKHSGFNVFWSSKFHHGHDPYKSFHINQAGKIEETLASGEAYMPIDVSITKNIASLLFSVILIIWVFLKVAAGYKKRPNKAPKGIQSFFEPIILFIRDEVAKPSIGHKYERFMPYLLTVFFFYLDQQYVRFSAYTSGRSKFNRKYSRYVNACIVYVYDYYFFRQQKLLYSPV
jgi:hypothetical protein